MLIGVDYHPSFQQIAFLVKATGEYNERRLNHSDGEAEKFYRELQLRGVQARVGMEATGYSRWFERLLAELGFEVWIGDPAEIKARRVKKQKTDRKDAQLLLQLMQIAFRGSGYRVRKIAMCVNCCGTGIGWCRCAHGL
jgi:transposase